MKRAVKLYQRTGRDLNMEKCALFLSSFVFKMYQFLKIVLNLKLSHPIVS